MPDDRETLIREYVEPKHDLSFAMSLALLDVVKPCLREEQWRPVFDEFYAICRASIDVYEMQKASALSALAPTAN